VRRAFAEQSATINFSQIDRAPEDLLNRILWNAMRDDEPFPEWAIKFVDEENEHDDEVASDGDAEHE
jgi:hypothetical protein